MLFRFNIYSSLLLIFFVHILVYAAMLWYRGIRKESIADKLLGSFLVVAALFVIPWMTGFAGWYDPKFPIYREILFYTPFVHGLFFGPLLYFYVKSITNFHFKFSRRDWFHFIPALFYLLWTIIVLITDKLIVGRYFLMNGENDPDFDSWYQWVQKLSILTYLLLSIKYYRQYKRYAFFELSFSEAAGFGWLRNFLIAFGVITALPVIQDILQLFPFFANLDYIGTWYYFFSFAVVVYYIAINGYNAISIPLRRLIFEPRLLSQYRAPALLNAPGAIEDISFEQIESNEEDKFISQWKDKVNDFVKAQKIYEEPELTLSELAKKLSTNTSLLSRVVNQAFGL
ncbi:MAG: hypothetical protein ACKVOW_05510, partial [Chitinophagaceae bacterium]